MVGWHHQLNGHEFEKILEDGEGQGSLSCCSPWGHKESDVPEQLNNKETSNLGLIKVTKLGTHIWWHAHLCLTQ